MEYTILDAIRIVVSFIIINIIILALILVTVLLIPFIAFKVNKLLGIIVVLVISDQISRLIHEIKRRNNETNI